MQAQVRRSTEFQSLMARYSPTAQQQQSLQQLDATQAQMQHCLTQFSKQVPQLVKLRCQMIFAAVEKAAIKRKMQAMFKLKQCSQSLATEQRCQLLRIRMLSQKAFKAWRQYNAVQQKQLVDFALARKFRYLHLCQFIISSLKRNLCQAQTKRKLEVKARLLYKQRLLANGFSLFK